MNSRILCLGTTPAAQRVMLFRRLELNAVNRASMTLEGASGKSINVAKVLRALGEHPVALGFAGGDRGALIQAGLTALQIEHAFESVEATTRQCTTVIDESTGAQTELVEESAPVQERHFAGLLARTERLLPSSRALVLSGTIATGGPQDLYARCVRLARTSALLTVVDAQGPALTSALTSAPGLVKPNRTELAATVGRPLADDTDVQSAVRELHERGAERIVVTAGSHPILAFDGRRFARVIPSTIQARNPIGSGDAFTAAAVWRLLRGDDLAEACRWGAAAGAANALTLMPGDLDRRDVDRLVANTRID